MRQPKHRVTAHVAADLLSPFYEETLIPLPIKENKYATA